MNATAQLPYSQWLNALDNLARTDMGISLYELPQLPYEHAHARDLSPEEFAELFIAEHLDRQHSQLR